MLVITVWPVNREGVNWEREEITTLYTFYFVIYVTMFAMSEKLDRIFTRGLKQIANHRGKHSYSPLEEFTDITLGKVGCEFSMKGEKYFIDPLNEALKIDRGYSQVLYLQIKTTSQVQYLQIKATSQVQSEEGGGEGREQEGWESLRESWRGSFP